MSQTYVKPSGLSAEYGAQFKDVSVVKAYKYREPYPEETFEVLRRLAGSDRPRVADLGCGTGDLSIGLSKFARQVDAVDISLEMLTEARSQAAPAHNIQWLNAPAETAPIQGPYDLITAADSVHWMNWPVLFRNMRDWLKEDGFFCVVGRLYESRDWWDEKFQAIINAFSTNKDFVKYEIVEELRKSGLVKIVDSAKVKPILFTQTVDELIEAFHSRNGFSRDRMGPSASAFDKAAREHLSSYAVSGKMQLMSSSQITWMTII